MEPNKKAKSEQRMSRGRRRELQPGLDSAWRGYQGYQQTAGGSGGGFSQRPLRRLSPRRNCFRDHIKMMRDWQELEEEDHPRYRSRPRRRKLQKYKDEEELSRRSGHEKLLFGHEFDCGKLNKQTPAHSRLATCPSDRPLGVTAPQLNFLMRKKVNEVDVEDNRSLHDVLNHRTISKTERDESLQETVGRMLDEYDYEDNEESKLIKLQKETSSFRFLACSTSDPGRVQINYVTGMSVTVGVERSPQAQVRHNTS